jgi:hypothetical protein
MLWRPAKVTPEEAATISGVLEVRRKVLETEELARRIERLEQVTAQNERQPT